MRPRIITAFAAATAAAALLAGCGQLGGAAGGAATATTAPASAQEKLAAAVPDTSAGRYAFSFKDATSSTDGVVDAASRKLSMTTAYKEVEAGFTLTMSYLVVDKDQWVKISFDKQLPGMPKLPKTWLRLDQSKIKDDPFTNLDDPDPVGAGALVDAIVEVSEAEPGTFAGTLDLTKATEASVVDDDGLEALGAKATAVPFTATLDDAGRLATIDIKVPAYAKVEAFTHHSTYDKYGSAPEVRAPAANASQDAPAAAYELLNS